LILPDNEKFYRTTDTGETGSVSISGIIPAHCSAIKAETMGNRKTESKKKREGALET